MKITDLKNILIFITLFLIAWIFLEAIKVTIAISAIPAPEPPRLVPDSSEVVQVAKSKEIENYKNLINAMSSRRVAVYDNVVSKSLIPIFTSLIAAVLTYIFVSKGIESLNNYINKKYGKHDGT